MTHSGKTAGGPGLEGAGVESSGVESRALDDLARAVSAKDDAARIIAAERVTDLFVLQAASFNDSHVALFDQVIALLADAIEARARARLSEKLADIANAPPGVVRRFAQDEIAVARPVLARSPRLTDTDLVDAARKGGRDHMLAISERKDLAEAVTEVLVAEGDRVVVNAVASNPTARFSDTSYDTLVQRSGADELLQAAIARRRDIPAKHMTVLFELAKKAARERLQTEIAQVSRRAVRDAVNKSARDIEVETFAWSDTHKEAVADIAALNQRNALTDNAIADFARRARTGHVICGLAVMAQAPVGLTERAVTGTDRDALIVLAKSIGLTWATVRVIVSMRPENKPSPRQIEQLSESYMKLAPATAQRLLRYMHARETVTGRR